ncbi:DegV family protein [Levilactobacillus bambusae]|uniref:DegV family protein n=1 Tax=Levilactobacillus bambusae TaxID=2024736 RepID=A0A2V1N1G2_9LACO|nr:DegV family protein [Levilactobacillus bambusae]PWG00150.1 DegV family protein [Levilactobacillus bambusae]
MNVAIVTDSVSYVSPEEVAKYNIHVVPVTIIFNGRPYKEGVDMTTEEFYHKLKTERELPSTAQVSIGEITAEYDKLAAEGYDTVISIHLSSGITSFLPNLEAYLPNITNIKVIPFDSKIAAMGEGMMVRLAARMAMDGRSADDIMMALNRLKATMDEYFVVDDLSHLVRTGRLSNASGFMGNLLRIKPILTFNEAGQIIAIDKEHTMKRAFAKIKRGFAEKIANVDYPVRAVVIDANNPKLSADWITELKQEFPQVTFETSFIGPVVGVHTGEKTMALLWSEDFESLRH